MSVKRRGKNWQATVRGPDGREVTKTFPKKAQADQWETRMKNHRLRGSWVDPRAGAIKLSDWVALYTERASHRRPTTVARDNAVLDHWVVPTLGNRALSSISPSDVRSLVSSMEDAKLAPRTVRSHYGVFRALLNAAVVEDREIVKTCG